MIRITLVRIVVFLAGRLITKFTRDGDRVFFESSFFPWAARLEAGWPAIRAELDTVLLDPSKIPNLEDVSEAQNVTEEKLYLSRGDEWKVFFLYGLSHKVEMNCARCPETARLVSSIPGMKTAMFSILAPGKHIPKHHGLYKGVIRYHLGVQVPKPVGVCRIEVHDEVQPWEEGKSLIFDDTWQHEVWNDSDQRRVILLLDIERPLPFPLSLMNRMILRLIAGSNFVTDAVERVENPQAMEIAKAARAARQL